MPSDSLLRLLPANPEIKPQPKKLYMENVKRTFFGGYIKSNQDGLIPVFIGFFHTIFLPITLTVGAGTKTVIDIVTRKPLSLNDVNHLKAQLPLLNDFGFHEVIKKIAAHSPISRLSAELKQEILDLENLAFEELKALRLDISYQVRGEFDQAYLDSIRNQMPANPLDFSLKIDEDRLLTSAELVEIDKRYSEQASEYYIEKRRLQTIAIINYIDNDLNAGTKMENIIQQTVEENYRPSR